MADDETSRLRCLAQIATLGGLARPTSSGARYRLTLSLIRDDSGSPVDGTLETRVEDVDDRLEQALVDASKIWVEFTPVRTEMHSSSAGAGRTNAGRRLRVLEAEDIEIRWQGADSSGTECPDCGGTGEIDLSIGPSRVVDCDRCDGTGTLDD